ncbi:transposable element Tcb1 transposase [Trichonephila clavipes]|nr:transposable element Tcb1 transposase [Trichonephila clavipes]
MTQCDNDKSWRRKPVFQPNQRKDSGLPRDTVDYLSGKSVVVLDESKTTVMRICDRWMQQVTTDRRSRSHPPQCTISREDRQIVRMAVTDRSVRSRTIEQHIEFVTHHSVSARTIRRHLQQSGLSARRPLFGLPLMQNHRRLRRQSLTHLSATPRCLDSSLEIPWRDDAEQPRYAPPHWSCTCYFGMGWYWILLLHSSSTHCRYFKQTVLYLRGVGANCPSLPSGLGHSHIST